MPAADPSIGLGPELHPLGFTECGSLQAADGRVYKTLLTLWVGVGV